MTGVITIPNYPRTLSETGNPSSNPFKSQEETMYYWLLIIALTGLTTSGLTSVH